MQHNHLSQQDLFKYWAFISYSNADTRWASWLHRALERYTIPRGYRGRMTQLGMTPKRLYPVFRDRDDAAAASDLTAEILHALQVSRFLIVVCSPRAASHAWVEKEVRAFIDLGRSDRIIPFIIDGEPQTSREPDGTHDMECFPPSLRALPIVPLAPDVRPGKDRRRLAVLKIVARVIEQGLGDLTRRDRSRRRRLMLLRTAATLVLLSTAVVAVSQYNERQELTERKRIGDIANTAENVTTSGNAGLALQQILATTPGRGVGPLDNLLEPALYHALHALRERLVLPYTGSLEKVRFSPDGQFIVAVGGDCRVYVWHRQTGRSVFVGKEHTAKIWDIQLSRSGALLVTASEDGMAIVWAIPSGAVVARLPHKSLVKTATFSPDEGTLLTVDRDQAQIWDLNTKAIKRIVEESVLHAAFTPDGRSIVTSTSTKITRVSNTLTEESFILSEKDQFGHLEFDASGQHLLTVGEREVVLWDAQAWKEIRRYSLTPKAPYLVGVGAHISADGNYIVAANIRSRPLLWRAGSLEPFRELGELSEQGTVSAIAFSHDGTRVLSAYNDGHWRVWEPRTGQSLGVFRGHTEGSHSEGIRDATFSPDSQEVATLFQDGTVRLWTVDAALRTQTLSGSTAPVDACVITDDGATLFTHAVDSPIAAWNMASQFEKPFATAPATTQRLGVHEPVVSPTGRFVATHGTYGIRLWNVETRSEERLLAEIDMNSIAFDSEGKNLLAVGEGDFYVIDVERGHVVWAYKTRQPPVSMAVFSPDGRWILSGHTNGMIQVWQAQGEWLGMLLDSGRETIQEPQFDAHGQRVLVITGEKENTVQVWDIKKRRMVRRIDYSNQVISAQFSRSGEQVATATEDGMVYVWQVTPGVWDAIRGIVSPAPWPIKGLAEVKDLQFVSDDQRLAVLDSVTLHLYDTATGNPIDTNFSRYDIDRFKVTKERRRIVTFYTEPFRTKAILRLWDATTGKLLTSTEYTGLITCDAMAPDGQRIIIGLDHGDIGIWTVLPSGSALWKFAEERALPIRLPDIAPQP